MTAAIVGPTVLILAACVGLLLSSAVDRVPSASAAAATETANANAPPPQRPPLTFRCIGPDGSPSRDIPSKWVNDGYCDCPHDGSDEVGTGACSGSIDGMWPGIPASSTASKPG